MTSIVRHGPPRPVAFPRGALEAFLGTVKVDARLRDRGAVVLGISADSAFSHAANAEARGFPFPLVSDIHRTVIGAYGKLDEAWNIAWRSTFIVDREGALRWGQRATATWSPTAPRSCASSI